MYFIIGKLLGCFLGKCSGSIRSIARHLELLVIVSCGEYIIEFFLCVNLHKNADTLTQLHLHIHINRKRVINP
jgi:hypothetical protein